LDKLFGYIKCQLVYTELAEVLRVPSFALTTALSRVLKAFQNPIWAEQARERLKAINLLKRIK
jgi:hypothetical protein